MKDITNPLYTAILRQKAEEILKSRNVKYDAEKIDVETFKLIHELDVHQIELEMQNDELVLAKKRAELHIEKYVDLYDFAPSAFLTLNKEGEIIQLNFYSAKILGKERSLLIKNRFGFFVSNETRNIFNEFFEKLLSTKTEQNCEVVLNVNTKAPIYVYLTGIASYDEDQCVITMIDISSQKKDEEVIKASEDKYRSLFENNIDSIIITNIDINPSVVNGSFLNINKAATELYGYTKKEMLLMDFNDLEKASKKTIQNRYKEFSDKGKLSFETIVITKKGNKKNIETQSFLIKYEGAPAIMHISRDITERKQNEANARKVLKNLATILDAIPDLLFEIGQDGRIYHCQSPDKTLLVVPPEQFIGKLFQEVLPADVSKICLEAIAEAIEKGRSTGKQYSLELAQRKCWFEISVFPIKESNATDKHFIFVARDITEQKLAEEALQKSDKILRAVLDNVPLGIWMIDKDGQMMLANSLFCDSIGITEAQFKSVPHYAELLTPEVAEACMTSDKEALKGDQFVLSNEKLSLTDGKIHDVEIIKKKIIGLHNDDSSLIGIMQDVTERKIAEETLRENVDKYRGLVENSPDAIIIYVEDKIVFINEEGLRMTQAKSNEEIIGKSVLDFIHPDSMESILQRMKDVLLDNNASVTIEERFVNLAGEAVDAEIKAIPTVFDHQRAVQVILHDITERKQTQEKIQQLSRAVEQSPVTIIITNTSGNIEYANPKFTEITGYTFEEILGKNPRILNSGHTSPDEYQNLWHTISNGNEWHGEFHNKKKNGELYWESASISPIINTQGKTTHYIAIKEDITDKKNVQEELIKAKERAEESDRLKLVFLANMSHEIRTPMNGILGFTELLKEPKLTGEEQQEYINIIEKSGKRMLNIINDIISISKVESGQVEISLSETNVNDQIDYLYTFFKPEAAQKGIELKVAKDLEEKDSIISTDKEKIYAILTNLVKNAIKFTDSGSIEFGCIKKDNNLHFFVKDTGLGISKAQQGIIFERFRQANETLTRTHEGSGLGLAISKAYVEMLGGKIGVESEEGKGSSFYFTIPFNEEYESEDKIAAAKEGSIIKADNKVKNLKVLIVEDDAISKLLITIAVKPYSKEILKVSTGYEAIETCRNNPDINLVMMDINMPEMGGYEATKQIREFNKDVVIIAQTANGMQSDKDNAIASGCTDYISKPVNIASLGVLIQKYFGQ